MRKIVPALLSLLLVLSLAPSAGAVSSPFLATPAARTVLINLVSTDGTPVPNAVIHLLTPGTPVARVARTNSQGQVSLEVTNGFSFWIRVWADGYALIEQPYVPASDGPVLTLRATPYTTLVTGVVRDDQGLPVARAQVNLYRAGYGLESTAMTNDLGLYTMKSVRADGSYTLQVEAKGYQPVSQSLDPLNPSGRNQADVALTPAFGTVTGEVVDGRSNRPVGGVKVELLLGGWGVVDTTTTDSLGYFYLPVPPLTNGVYQVRLSRLGFETSTSAGFSSTPGGWNDFSGANRFTVNRLHAKINGKVADADNKPLQQVEVHLHREGLGTVEIVKTDDEGKYQFTQVTSGNYRVRAYPTGDLVRSDSGWLTVAGGDDLTANLVAVVPTKTGYGSESLAGTVTNHLGDPVVDATVTIHRGQEVLTAQTDEEGRYDIPVSATIPDNLGDDDAPDPSTGYHVSVSAPRYLTNDQVQTDDETPPPGLVAIQIDADNQANFVLQPETASIAGRVVSDRGQLLPGVKVGLLQEGRSVVAETSTDAAGRYQFPDLPFAKQGRYIPVIMDADYVHGPIAPGGTPVDPTTLSPANPTSITLMTRPSFSIIQGLVQAGSDKAADGAEVTVLRPADGRSFTTASGADGSYQLKVPAVPGEQYLVRATTKDAAANADASVTILENTYGAQVNLTVHPTASISGRVFQPTGKAAAGVRMILYAEGSAVPAKTAITDAAGGYRFTDLTPGRRYAVLAEDPLSELSALAPGELVITPLIALPSGQTQWADLMVSLPPAPVNP